MLRPRIIPCLLIQNNGLVKTVKFEKPKYVGDPINAVRIFNEKEADELMVLDIDASVMGRAPDFKLIERLAAECRMPLCYGGGVKNREQARELISLGVEKVALSSALVENPGLAADIADEIGRQSVVAVLDVKKKRFSKKHEIWTRQGKNNTMLCPIELSQALQDKGIGELVINSIDHDGMMNGYDFELIEQIHKNMTVPMSVLGGAGSQKDIGALIQRFGIIGAGAGSLFVFKGTYKAVLINYPNPEAKNALINSALRTH